ncbi:alpha-galactosidase [Lysobacter korlensis]|uniref:Alpha-galactosidase n=1 Tax=Lysobacter korlensis TaxID=553636 RepID=A0ABV6RVD7_9GAMM
MSPSDAVGTARPVVLTAAGVSVVVDASAAIPRVLYWGRAAALSDSDLDTLSAMTGRQWTVDGVQGPVYPSLLPEQSHGWMGTPGIEGHRNGSRFSTRFERPRVDAGDTREGGRYLESNSVDPSAELALLVRLDLLPSGVLRLAAELTNTSADSSYELEALRIALPVPAEAQEILDFAGRHLRERSPQRHAFTVGTHLREGRRGRTGSDATPLLAVGTPGFGFGRGEVWAVHTAWSGNHRTYAELGLPGLRVVGGGEVLLPGEVRLAPGERYRSPELYAAYGEGLNEVAGAFHAHLRSRATHPRSPRPVVLNTWEAVYFQHDLAALTELAQVGARVGVERFVLDDGWFRSRRNDKAGLGDWQVDESVWPDGLQPLVDVVRSLGMDFGLWFEPEMVNEDSDLARAHPDWILGPGERLPLPGRNQQVLNLAVPEAYDYILDSISTLVARYGIDYIKWDHNRDLVEAGDRRSGEPRVHEQTLATYRLMDELRRRHPRLEIESCSSGGGRVDLGVLQRTDRVWASDCIDALERQQIQRWTGLLLPPELIGSHVGAPVAHTTHRTHSLAFRAATAVFGHFGIEWDLRGASEQELAELARWVQLYKEERQLLHSGRLMHSDSPDPSYWSYGVVSEQRDRALIAFVAMATGVSAQPGRIRIPGLDPATQYRLEPVDLSLEALFANSGALPPWISEPLTVSGEALATLGLQAPMLYPEQAFLVRITRSDATAPR